MNKANVGKYMYRVNMSEIQDNPEPLLSIRERSISVKQAWKVTMRQVSGNCYHMSCLACGSVLNIFVGYSGILAQFRHGQNFDSSLGREIQEMKVPLALGHLINFGEEADEGKEIDSDYGAESEDEMDYEIMFSSNNPLIIGSFHASWMADSINRSRYDEVSV